MKPKRYWITEKEGVFICNGKTYDSLEGVQGRHW
jgi:hypothetical protein